MNLFALGNSLDVDCTTPWATPAANSRLTLEDHAHPDFRSRNGYVAPIPGSNHGRQSFVL
jgi:hypothetical protein